jgi:predicted RNA-binding Zn-ribbon protein involved in translation (DUF1610 family)
MKHKLNKEQTFESKLRMSNNEVAILFVDDVWTFPCPHCGLLVQVGKKDVRCKI